MNSTIRSCIKINGIVQGVGFRPFVYNLAHEYGLKGWVYNYSGGVEIEVEGDGPRIKEFISDIRDKHPPMACILNMEVRDSLPLQGYRDFDIRESRQEENLFVPVSPDISICQDCLRELMDPEDRRYRYPFINCTNCGPRFTITQDIPYDRIRTTMSSFTMCSSCQEEYDDPHNRRFHAQPNACPECGPTLKLWNNSGNEITTHDPLGDTIALLRRGKIVAIKGLGGFHLACDAAREEVVAQLRGRKYREDKPFAIMCRDLEVIERLCLVDGLSRDLLRSKERPIVILPRRRDARIASSVAPFQRTLGVMLPYTPLHHLLFAQGVDVLVMTSGNVSDEPIAFKDREALDRLKRIADFFLIHNREIHTRCDDSVLKPIKGTMTFLRRARGFAPFPITLGRDGNSVLACGADLKNTFCLTRADSALLSQHIGDMENFETVRSFEQGVGLLKQLFRVEPEFVVHDLHPDYLSTRYAVGLDLPRIGVQHHFAHALSCMAEYGCEGPGLAVVMDGTGYGADGTVWGGEFLEVTVRGYRRLGHLRYIPLPGGDMAVREPWRMGAAYLERIYGDLEETHIPFVEGLDRERWSQVRLAMRAQINSPPCSSMGRLFDAVSAILGVRDTVNYEGQAAIELEQMVEEGELGEYPFEVLEDSGMLIVNPDPLVEAVVEDIRREESPSAISARFHNSIARAISRVAHRIRGEHGLSDIFLSGGVFQNHVLLGRVWDMLEEDGFRVHTHQKVPPNDGGISLGQAFYGLCCQGA